MSSRVAAHFSAMPADFVDSEMFESTVKIRCLSGFAFRGDILDILIDKGLKNPSDIVGIYQRKSSSEYYATFTSTEVARKFSDLGFTVINGKRFEFSSISEQRVRLRVHWVPLYIKNIFLERLFRKFGKDIQVTNETTIIRDAVIETGIRTVSMTVNEREKHLIPHIVETDCGMKCLVTCPGRLPLCLKCNNLGHIRANCDADDKSYADALARRDKLLAARDKTRAEKESTPQSVPVEKTVPEDQVSETEEENIDDHYENVVSSEEEMEEDEAEDDTPVPNTAEPLFSSNDALVVPETQMSDAETQPPPEGVQSQVSQFSDIPDGQPLLSTSEETPGAKRLRKDNANTSNDWGTDMSIPLIIDHPIAKTVCASPKEQIHGD